ncbi:AraC family transcriptional regulator [Wukongibacter baidiensis]|uniref:AraC family transcriptional regulator n=1 Tax=Wukongibacter baidiensis TaxID=1723361 RepID=UPI003D7F84BD
MIFNENGKIIIEILDELLKTYFMSTGVSILAIDGDGNTLVSYGDSYKFCGLYNQCIGRTCNCKEEHLSACRMAINIGEPYFSYCPLDFVHISAPLIYKDSFFGGLVAGPIIMNTPESQFSKDLMLSKVDSPDMLKKLSSYCDSIAITDPIRTNYLGNILFMMASKEIENYQSLLAEKKKRMVQQCKINEQIQIYKDMLVGNDNLYKKEKDLFAKVRSGNIVEARVTLNDLLALIFLEEGGNIEVIKARVMELCSLLSRAAIEGGAPLKDMLAFNYLLFEDLNKLHNLEEISFWMLKVLDYYTENAVNLSSTKNTDIIKKSIIYINKHFRSSIKLDDVASHVHLNSTYFSTLFKKEIGMSFSEYVQKIRVEESKYLLTSTSNSILDVAISVGFDSQSYFCKVFKKYTELSPKKYRLKFS